MLYQYYYAWGIYETFFNFLKTIRNGSKNIFYVLVMTSKTKIDDSMDDVITIGGICTDVCVAKGVVTYCFMTYILYISTI